MKNNQRTTVSANEDFPVNFIRECLVQYAADNNKAPKLVTVDAGIEAHDIISRDPKFDSEDQSLSMAGLHIIVGSPLWSVGSKFIDVRIND